MDVYTRRCDRQMARGRYNEKIPIRGSAHPADRLPKALILRQCHNPQLGNITRLFAWSKGISSHRSDERTQGIIKPSNSDNSE